MNGFHRVRALVVASVKPFQKLLSSADRPVRPSELLLLVLDEGALDCRFEDRGFGENVGMSV